MIKGNLITLAEQGEFDMIIHGCNCFHTMGAGIAQQLRLKYPGVRRVDREKTVRGDKDKLGTYTSYVPIGHRFTVINAYTQYNYGSRENGPYVDYSAIKRVFTSLAPKLKGMRIGYPRIGCGLAGGQWNLVKDIIDTAFAGLNHELVVLDYRE